MKKVLQTHTLPIRMPLCKTIYLKPYLAVSYPLCGGGEAARWRQKIIKNTLFIFIPDEFLPENNWQNLKNLTKYTTYRSRFSENSLAQI
jgi:hypothetical protein